MQVQIRSGGDGVACWNTEAVLAYASAVDEQEARVAAGNPDVDVRPGKVSCYGCEVMEYDLGVRCTASLTRTLFSVRGEVSPRTADAAAPITAIPGMVTRLDAPAQPVVAETPNPAGAAAPSSSPPRQPVRRGLFGRRS